MRLFFDISQEILTKVAKIHGYATFMLLLFWILNNHPKEEKRMKKTAIFVVSAMILFSSSAIFAHEGHKTEHKHPYPTVPFGLYRGKVLYKQYCASCHGSSGDGQGPAAGSLNPKPTNFLDMPYMVMRSRVDHFESISNSRPGTAMPPWKETLSAKDIWDIIAYIEHLFNHQSAKDHKAH